MVKITGCSKHETFGYCMSCAFDSLKEERDALRAALEWYADSKNWTSMTDGWKQLVCVDSSDREYIPGNELMIQTGGKRAREALNKKD